MDLADELKKLQQLKIDGVLTEEEFTQAKQKLLSTDTPEAAPSPPTTIKLSLKEGLDEIVDEESTLGGAANRYVDYKKTSAIIGAVVFIVFVIVMALTFANTTSKMERSFERPSGFPEPASRQIYISPNGIPQPTQRHTIPESSPYFGR